jgi:hypothetical protein
MSLWGPAEVDARHAGRLLGMMGDEERRPAGGQSHHLVGEGAGSRRVEVCGGLDEDEDGPIGQQCAGDAELLAFAAGDRAAVPPDRVETLGELDVPVVELCTAHSVRWRRPSHGSKPWSTPLAPGALPPGPTARLDAQ